MKLGVKELIKLCIYCWGHPLLYTCSGFVAVWMLLSGNLQQVNQLVLVWFGLVCTLWSYWFDLTITGNQLGLSRLDGSSLVRGRVTFAISDTYLASCPRPDRMCVTVCLPALG
jgi:hypothetical protein